MRVRRSGRGGFEYFASRIRDEDCVDFPTLPAEYDFAVTFATHSDMRELATSVIAAAVLCQLAGGRLSDSQAGEDVAAVQALSWGRRAAGANQGRPRIVRRGTFRIRFRNHPLLAKPTGRGVVRDGRAPGPQRSLRPTRRVSASPAKARAGIGFPAVFAEEPRRGRQRPATQLRLLVFAPRERLAGRHLAPAAHGQAPSRRSPPQSSPSRTFASTSSARAVVLHLASVARPVNAELARR